MSEVVGQWSKKCPKCGDFQVKRIVYGMIRPGSLKDDEAPGGCVVDEDSPKWHCDACHWEWNESGQGEYNSPEDE